MHYVHVNENDHGLYKHLPACWQLVVSHSNTTNYCTKSQTSRLWNRLRTIRHRVILEGCDETLASYTCVTKEMRAVIMMYECDTRPWLVYFTPGNPCMALEANPTCAYQRYLAENSCNASYCISAFGLLSHPFSRKYRFTTGPMGVTTALCSTECNGESTWDWFWQT